MTDKEQIMIDGVNVGGCKYLNTFSDCDGYHYYCDLADDIKNEYCEYYKDCYFKQLARKTQECKELEDYARRQENQRETYYKEFLKKDKALEEIEKVCLEDTCTFADGTQIRYDSLDDILDIINKAKGKSNG